MTGNTAPRSGHPPLQTVSTGIVVAIVGFFSSFPILLQGVAAMGATPDQAASALMTAAVAMGVTGAGLSLWKRQPISVAWSTPGSALLAVNAMPQGGFAEAVGAFLVAGLLVAVAGFWRPLGRLTAMIPGPIAQSMLAGVLLSLCIKPFQALAISPAHALPVIAAWFLVGRVNRLFAVPAAVLAATAVTIWAAGFQIPAPPSVLTAPVWVSPQFSIPATLSIALPLFIVTMATQNIPGIAVMRSYGYQPDSRPLFTTVGAASMASAPFGAPATCLAAITAAMCANPDCHPDPKQRYWSAVVCGLFYTLFGLFAGIITSFAGLAPNGLLGTLAGVALLGVFAGSAHAALEDPEYREAAAITFAVTASGVTILGLSGAVWGLIAGAIVVTAKRR